MYPDCLVDCSGWSNMDMLRFMYFREKHIGMTHAHTHSTTIMNCNDKEAYKFLMNKVFSITYIDRALIVKNYIDNELVKYHPHLAPIICWYNALLYRFYWPYMHNPVSRNCAIVSPYKLNSYELHHQGEA